MADLHDYTDDHLMHYGTKGMHWGVWNAETARKYAGGSRKNGSNVKTDADTKSKARVGDVIKSKAKRVFNTVSENRRAKKEIQSRMTSQGITTKKGREAYEQLRKITLASTDPEIVAKGMHTLSDSELSLKIERMNKEKAIRELAVDQATKKSQVAVARENAKRAAKERRRSGISGSLATKAGEKVIDVGHDLAVSTGKALIAKKTGLDLGVSKKGGSNKQPKDPMSKAASEAINIGKELINQVYANSKKPNQPQNSQQKNAPSSESKDNISQKSTKSISRGEELVSEIYEYEKLRKKSKEKDSSALPKM